MERLQLGKLVAKFKPDYYGLFFGAPLFIIGFILSQNEAIDRDIRELCTQFTTQNGCYMEYRTEFTGFCKPKHAQPLRGLAISSTGGIGHQAGKMFAAQVPPDSGPGSTLQVTAPNGQLVQVQVPELVGPGQQFMVQTP